MKAWVQDGRTLTLQDRPEPEPRRGQVLVRVRAAGLNGADWELSTGAQGYLSLPGARVKRPKTPGSDIAGTVEAVGPGVTGFARGDAVIGNLYGTFGGLAERVAVPSRQLVAMPRGLDFTAAATLPQSILMAHQALTRPGPLAKGARILIIGAGGGAGTMAVQMAKAAGLSIGVADRGSKLQKLRQLGAREVYDTEREDVTAAAQPFERIVDFHATARPAQIARILSPGGQYWALGGELQALLRIALFARFTPAARGRSMAVLHATQTGEALSTALALVERGIVSPQIDRIYPIAQADRALARLATGEVFGKLVVRFS